jgi:hypothetical protein
VTALRVLEPAPVADDFWDRPRTAAELRERLRTVLLDEIGDSAERIRRVVVEALLTEPTRRSPADILFLVDEIVAEVRREERGERAA